MNFSKFTGSFSTTPINSGLELINYFYFLFGKESFDILRDQLKLYSIQVNPHRTVNISDTDVRHFIGINNLFLAAYLRVLTIKLRTISAIVVSIVVCLLKLSSWQAACSSIPQKNISRYDNRHYLYRLIATDNVCCSDKIVFFFV